VEKENIRASQLKGAKKALGRSEYGGGGVDFICQKVPKAVLKYST
jgi:hypothetical protein